MTRSLEGGTAWLQEIATGITQMQSCFECSFDRISLKFDSVEKELDLRNL